MLTILKNLFKLFSKDSFGFSALLQYPKIEGKPICITIFLLKIWLRYSKKYCFIFFCLIFIFVFVSKHFLRSHTHSHLSLATSVGNRSVTSMWRERYYNLFESYFFFISLLTFLFFLGNNIFNNFIYDIH